MILSFLARQFNFFDLLEEQVSHVVEAARFLREAVVQDHVSEEMLAEMARIEHQGDDAAHTIVERLNKTFITPFDREDTCPGMRHRCVSVHGQLTRRDFHPLDCSLDGCSARVRLAAAAFPQRTFPDRPRLKYSSAYAPGLHGYTSGSAPSEVLTAPWLKVQTVFPIQRPPLTESPFA